MGKVRDSYKDYLLFLCVILAIVGLYGTGFYMGRRTCSHSNVSSSLDTIQDELGSFNVIEMPEGGLVDGYFMLYNSSLFRLSSNDFSRIENCTGGCQIGVYYQQDSSVGFSIEEKSYIKDTLNIDVDRYYVIEQLDIVLAK